MSRRNIWIPPMLWKRVQKESLRATAREKKLVGYAEIIRRAIEAYLSAK